MGGGTQGILGDSGKFSCHTPLHLGGGLLIFQLLPIFIMSSRVTKKANSQRNGASTCTAMSRKYSWEAKGISPGPPLPDTHLLPSSSRVLHSSSPPSFK